MKKYLHTALGIAICVSLAACHSDDDDDDPVVIDPPTPTPTTLDISGSAIKGTLANAMVEVFAASDLTTAVGSAAQTDASGNFSVTITDSAGNPITGAFYIVVSADDDTIMVCDAATCGGTARGGTVEAADLEGLSLSSMVYADGTATSLTGNVNAITTLASDAMIAAAEDNANISLGTVTMDGFTSLQLSASQLVAGMVGLTLAADTNVFNVGIVDASVATNVPADEPAATLTLLNATFAGITEVADANSKVSSANIGASFKAFKAAFKQLVAAVTKNPEADLESEASEALQIVRNTQTFVSTGFSSMVVLVESEGGAAVVAIIPSEVAVNNLVNAITNSGIGTGGTGGG